MNFETIIGLEVHAELATESKIFCGCSNTFGASPNTQTCPICLGHPGVLPVLNKKAVNFAIKAALALNCEIATDTKFDRKNYFYPDLPKAYQISQYDKPIGENGWIEIEVHGKKKRIGITRLHLEEDAGKLNHMDGTNYSLVDFNRGGVPLIEIVSEPDMRSPEEAYAYLEKLKAILSFCQVSDVKMEQGSLRCDANVSLRPFGAEKFGTKTELKNLNSFRHVEKGLQYEVERQTAALMKGEVIRQETRRWDETKNMTIMMRSKEAAHDYRYFPEPDLVHLHIDDAWKEAIRQTIPELPDARRARYVSEYSLPEYDATILTSSLEVANFFEEGVHHTSDAKGLANWMMGEFFAYLNANALEIQDVKMSAAQLGDMLEMIVKGTISTKIAKTVFQEMMETGKDPEVIVKEKGLVQISDEGTLRKIVDEVLDKNPQSIEDFKAGKDRAVGFLVGQVMKATKGKANPQLVNQLIQEGLTQR
ncbi:Asp-tRNA(Asn)/Glu-tRNA(Gln) amidotransferase subunit GatB [Rubeoparvulum massiliense]|uniref:Asp-tRNA(Asn)/Glu-tRNA(Gln) amidotransferase subunit GatB n=1 Tax=Rubeoparvulum massiliense TaxID=1631346 RepID=UPI00065DE976|nr:Asp-tRNA(Asn)/Glu-tRNA(Gln) amidotransferase subunit GatB [Rubeoparvulum massiliense]